MKDGDFVLCESHAMMRYLCTTREVPDNWYPKDAKKRAKCDEYLDWHHTNLRNGVTGQVFKSFYAPLMGLSYPKEEIDMHQKAFV